MKFLSERNLEMHKAYLNELMLKYRIFEKSYGELIGKNLDGIYKLNLQREEKVLAAKLFAEISAHKIYFDSFGERNTSSDRVKRKFGSVGQFLYEITEKCKAHCSGFLLIYENGNKIETYCGDEYENILRRKKVTLALDLCEHAYFYDYGFGKEEYVKNAVTHFNLSKL